YLEALRSIARATSHWDSPRYAESNYRAIVQIVAEVDGKKGKGYYAALIDLAHFLRNHQRWEEAETAFSEAIAASSKLPDGDEKQGHCLIGIAQTRLERHLYKEAISAGEQAVDKVHDESLTADLQSMLSELYARTNQTEKSEVFYNRFAEPARLKNPYGMIIL